MKSKKTSLLNIKPGSLGFRGLACTEETILAIEKETGDSLNWTEQQRIFHRKLREKSRRMPLITMEKSLKQTIKDFKKWMNEE